MKWLLVLALLSACDDAPQDNFGKIGFPCFRNSSCDTGATCVSWKKGTVAQSVCAAPQDLVIGSFELVKCAAESPPPPSVQVPQLRCQVVLPPLAAAAKCPPVPEGPCPEVKACEPGWKRAK